MTGKLRFYFVHPPGALLLKLCTRDFLYAPSSYLVMIKFQKKCPHAGCTPPKIVHPAAEMCTPGAGCTPNFGHCRPHMVVGAKVCDLTEDLLWFVCGNFDVSPNEQDGPEKGQFKTAFFLSVKEKFLLSLQVSLGPTPAFAPILHCFKT